MSLFSKEEEAFRRVHWEEYDYQVDRSARLLIWQKGTQAAAVRAAWCIYDDPRTVRVVYWFAVYQRLKCLYIDS